MKWKTDKDFEDFFLNAYDNKRDIDEEIIETLIWDYRIDEIEHDEHRWTKTIETIVEVQNRLFSICWERGLTEYQENIYDDAEVREVEKHTKTVTTIVTTYLPIEREI